MSSDTLREAFRNRGWVRLGPDPDLLGWVDAVLPVARRKVSRNRERWLRCAGTWFAGVNLLPNDASGAIGGGPVLSAALTAKIEGLTGFSGWSWDRAQISVCYRGYPRQGKHEGDAAFRFRRDRDAAHLDGLLPVGARRRRHLREHHGFILGIPLVETSPRAAPLVIWEGSHRLVGAAFAEILAPHPPGRWGELDVTERYHALRSELFERCNRACLHALPGEAYLVHRHALHGISLWEEDAWAPEDGRMIAYFRPDPFPGLAPDWWLSGED